MLGAVRARDETPAFGGSSNGGFWSAQQRAIAHEIAQNRRLAQKIVAVSGCVCRQWLLLADGVEKLGIEADRNR
jgi:hypothetical protein